MISSMSLQVIVAAFLDFQSFRIRLTRPTGDAALLDPMLAFDRSTER
jgi:hypothetical protein